MFYNLYQFQSYISILYFHNISDLWNTVKVMSRRGEKICKGDFQEEVHKIAEV
jgi:hypothetical protein